MLTRKHQFYLVITIPVINVIADSTQGFSRQGIFSPGYLRAYLILSFIFLYFNRYFKRNIINNVVLFNIIYFFILVLFSSDVSYSFGVYLKFLIASFMLPIGFYYVNTLQKFRKLLKSFLISLSIYLFFLFIANIFNLGSSDYLENSLYFGAGRVNMTKPMMILTLLFPLIFIFNKRKKNKIALIVVLILSIVFIFLGVKRSAIFGIIVGYIVYFFFTSNKTNTIKYLFGISILLLISTPFYFSTFQERFEKRQEAGRFDPSQAEDEESRYKEIFMVLDDYNKSEFINKVFGKEMFNSISYFKMNRMLHTNFATVFHGSGVVGIFLFSAIVFFVLIKLWYLKKQFNNYFIASEMIAVSFAIISAMLLTAISGSITTIAIRSISYLFLGSVIGTLSNLPYNSKTIKVNK